MPWNLAERILPELGQPILLQREALPEEIRVSASAEMGPAPEENGHKRVRLPDDMLGARRTPSVRHPVDRTASIDRYSIQVFERFFGGSSNGRTTVSGSCLSRFESLSPNQLRRVVRRPDPASSALTVSK